MSGEPCADILEAELESLQTDLAQSQEDLRKSERRRREKIDEIVSLQIHIRRVESENQILRAHNASYVSGASYASMLETLTHAQARGSELQDEVRALRRVLRDRLSLPTLLGNVLVQREALVQREEQFEVLVDLLKVRWRGDAKYGTAEAHADLPLMAGPSPILSITKEALKHHQAEKKARASHATWNDVLLEEQLELDVEMGSEEPDLDRVEAEAFDVANVHLKMVEAIRIRRARGAR